MSNNQSKEAPSKHGRRQLRRRRSNSSGALNVLSSSIELSNGCRLSVRTTSPICDACEYVVTEMSDGFVTTVMSFRTAEWKAFADTLFRERMEITSHVLQKSFELCNKYGSTGPEESRRRLVAQEATISLSERTNVTIVCAGSAAKTTVLVHQVSFSDRLDSAGDPDSVGSSFIEMNRDEWLALINLQRDIENTDALLKYTQRQEESSTNI